MNTRETRECAAYWETACQFFRSSGYAESNGSYFIHNKNNRTVKIGIMCQSKMYDGDSTLSYIKEEKVAVDIPQLENNIFKRAKNILDVNAPYFFIASPDVNRRFVDESLPKVLFVQPDIEFTFSDLESHGQISYARDAGSKKQGRLMLREFAEKSVTYQTEYCGKPMQFSEMAASWTPVEEDDNFLKRLDSAISSLQDFPNGKITLTRAYEYPVPRRYNPFQLYELHARLNGEYACSHYICILEDVFSLGCSPENVFEIREDKLVVDVVAATCRATTSDEYLARELRNDPKQIKEHKMSLNRRVSRFSPFCKGGVVKIIREMQVKRLRNVCHLHSVINGELLPDITIFDLLGNISFPLLGTYPKELVPVADAELDPHRYYGGIIGHAHSKSGGCFLNIRNALLKHNVIHAKVGVGLVKESVAERELLETRDKIFGLMEAIHLWKQHVARNKKSTGSVVWRQIC